MSGGPQEARLALLPAALGRSGYQGQGFARNCDFPVSFCVLALASGPGKVPQRHVRMVSIRARASPPLSLHDCSLSALMEDPGRTSIRITFKIKHRICAPFSPSCLSRVTILQASVLHFCLSSRLACLWSATSPSTTTMRRYGALGRDLEALPSHGRVSTTLGALRQVRARVKVELGEGRSFRSKELSAALAPAA